ncbi:ERMES complex subunit mmm1, variant 2 [Orbilia oligospora]|uniref:Maintenance of mitochondrial morphology protein 1 n=2 Tax=Orbilia oligospora TaxID=2813651 RepID=A0A6G1M1A1_ORBOL|nr:ERMES complex subunit mmm1, variant 2 [Orbilia oligospora]KAF3231619.1 ERMES complex subunit mmm1, variant 2 [Orbilia oligospora]KAF3240717.1 ERMES complex subunit mmm1, variant 2 [Orbilia oligospora]
MSTSPATETWAFPSSSSQPRQPITTATPSITAATANMASASSQNQPVVAANIAAESQSSPHSQSPPLQPLVPRSSSNWSFLQGFLIGQLSVIIMICAFIKYFIFSDPSTDSSSSRSKRNNSSSRKLHKKKSTSVLRNPPPLTTATILSKTYYNVHSHQPESLDWFNVLIAQAIAQFRDDARTDGAILDSLNKVINGPNKPDFLDTIKITEISLGEDFPIFSNCRITPSPDEPGKLQARMDVDLSDVITLGVETRLLLNYPKPLVAVLPVGLSVSILRFSGTLSISFIPSQENTSNSTTLTFSLLDDYRLELSVRSLVGSRSRLQDVPKIAQLIESRIHAWIDERVVEPKFQQIVLPSLWPRKRTTREHAPDTSTDSDSIDKGSNYRDGGVVGGGGGAGVGGGGGVIGGGSGDGSMSFGGSHRSNSMRQRRPPLMTTMHHHDYPTP